MDAGASQKYSGYGLHRSPSYNRANHTVNERHPLAVLGADHYAPLPLGSRDCVFPDGKWAEKDKENRIFTKESI